MKTPLFQTILVLNVLFASSYLGAQDAFSSKRYLEALKSETRKEIAKSISELNALPDSRPSFGDHTELWNEFYKVSRSYYEKCVKQGDVQSLKILARATFPLDIYGDEDRTSYSWYSGDSLWDHGKQIPESESLLSYAIRKGVKEAIQVLITQRPISNIYDEWTMLDVFRAYLGGFVSGKQLIELRLAGFTIWGSFQHASGEPSGSFWPLIEECRRFYFGQGTFDEEKMTFLVTNKFLDVNDLYQNMHAASPGHRINEYGTVLDKIDKDLGLSNVAFIEFLKGSGAKKFSEIVDETSAKELNKILMSHFWGVPFNARVDTDVLNVRSRPSTSSDKLGCRGSP